MGGRIAVVASKGGVGKTTLTVNLAGAFAADGQSVLVIDCDPQANLTDALGVTVHQGMPTLADVLRQSRVPLRDAVASTSFELIDIVPADQRTLQAAEREMVAERGIERHLARELTGFDDIYDWILLDCPPSLHDLTLSAVVASDAVVAVVETGPDAVKGGLRVAAYLRDLRAAELADKPLLGGVWSMFDARGSVMNRLAEEKLAAAEFPMFRTRIPSRQIVRQARELRQPVVELKPMSDVSIAFRHLAAELAQATVPSLVGGAR